MEDDDVNGDLSDRPRNKSFTPNWQQSLSRTVGLPVKFAGKVVSVYKDTKEKAVEESDHEAEEVVFKRKRSDKIASDSNGDSKTEVEPRKKKKVESTSLPMKFIPKSTKEIQRIRMKVAEISFCLTADPSAAFRAKST
mmetsp:Transcript_22674/g.31109  ORF Transcript_22674/g.31109 Transcript_22674/m.31109 type:complete len:138 (-) Transcript_22674:29-442(-)